MIIDPEAIDPATLPSDVAVSAVSMAEVAAGPMPWAMPANVPVARTPAG